MPDANRKVKKLSKMAGFVYFVKNYLSLAKEKRQIRFSSVQKENSLILDDKNRAFKRLFNNYY